MAIDPLDAARMLGMDIRGRKFRCPESHRGDAWVSVGQGRWKCHNCGAFGDSADLARRAGIPNPREWAGGMADHTPAPDGIAQPAHTVESAQLALELDNGHDPDPLVDWCRSRCLPADVAYAAGVRGGQANYAMNHPAARDKWPFYTSMRGTFWPAYHPDRLSGPLLWRFRPVKPYTTKEGRVVKCASMSAPMASVVALYRPGTGLCVICEGEPDWLVWCARRPQATVVGLVSGRWRAEYARFAHGCAEWAWVGHECDHEARVRAGITESATAYGAKLHVRTVPEDFDWADQWRASLATQR